MTSAPTTTADDLRRVALEQFAANGYLATSLQQIADAAGVSKASVLYHYGSKEVLLEAVLTPALDGLEQLIRELEGMGNDRAARGAFLGRFVDFLLAERLAVHIFVNQQTALAQLPVMNRASELVQRIAQYFERNTNDLEEQMRFGIALAGAAYLLAQHGQWQKAAMPPPPEEARPVLVRILSELIGGR